MFVSTKFIGRLIAGQLKRKRLFAKTLFFMRSGGNQADRRGGGLQQV